MTDSQVLLRTLRIPIKSLMTSQCVSCVVRTPDVARGHVFPYVSKLCFCLVMQAGTSCTISEFLLEQSSAAVQILTMLVQGGGPVRDHGGHNGHTGAGTGHGHGGRVPPAARDAAEDVQCPDAPSEPPNRLHLLCGGPHVGSLLGQSAGESALSGKRGLWRHQVGSLG